MIKTTLISILISTSFSIASASTDLESLDQFLAGDRFQTAFQAGDQTEVERKSCAGPICDSFKVYYRVVSVNGSEASIRTVKADGSLLEETRVSQTDWENLRHNRLRQRIQSMESYGFQVEIQSILPSQTSISVNGEMQNIETRIVTLAGRNGAGMKTVQTLEIGTGLGGLAQFLRSSEKKTVGTESSTVLRLVRP